MFQNIRRNFSLTRIMLAMKRTVLILVIGGLLSNQALFAADCTSVVGEFKVWNGWPPALRLTDSKTKITYGVTEDSALPKKMEIEVTSNHSAKGKFCLQTLKNIPVPYQKEPITLVKVLSLSHSEMRIKNMVREQLFVILEEIPL